MTHHAQNTSQTKRNSNNYITKGKTPSVFSVIWILRQNYIDNREKSRIFATSNEISDKRGKCTQNKTNRIYGQNSVK